MLYLFGKEMNLVPVGSDEINVIIAGTEIKETTLDVEFRAGEAGTSCRSGCARTAWSTGYGSAAPRSCTLAQQVKHDNSHDNSNNSPDNLIH